MQIYFREVNTNVPQVDILRLIYDQVRVDPRFTTAAEQIQSKIEDNKTGNGFVPPEFHVNNIASTIMDMYDMRQRETLSEPRRKQITALDVPIIHRMQTRNSVRGSAPRPQGSRQLASYGGNQDETHDMSTTGIYNGMTETKQTNDQNRSNAQPVEKPCKCCLTYGHDETNCTKTGATISIAQYLRNCSQEKKREILNAYRENRIAAHERYKQAYNKRRQLKKQIRRLEYDHSFDEQKTTWKQLDDAATQHLQQLRIAAVVKAKEDHPDLDFGSLDLDYADVSEPQLEFDPKTDDLPLSE